MALLVYENIVNTAEGIIIAVFNIVIYVEGVFPEGPISYKLVIMLISLRLCLDICVWDDMTRSEVYYYCKGRNRRILIL